VGGAEQENSRDAFIFPNPLDKTLYWGVLTDKKLQKASLQIYNSLGMLIHSATGESETSSFSSELPTDCWTAGFYFIYLQTQQEGESGKEGRTYHFKTVKK